MMLTALLLTAGLLAAPNPQPESSKGWVVELHGYIYHREAKPEGWIIELRGFTEHGKQAEPPQIDPVESRNHDDLSAYFNQWKVQMQVESLESFYVDDLPAFFDQLKNR